MTQQRLPARRVESARPRRRMQREPVERRARRFVVGESLRPEGREAAHPLRPGRRRPAKDRRSREVPFGVALPVRLALVLEGPELAAPAKVSLQAPDQALQHSPTSLALRWPSASQASSPPSSRQVPSSAIRWRCGLSRKSGDVLSAAVTAPLFAPRPPSPARAA